MMTGDYEERSNKKCAGVKIYFGFCVCAWK